ncbi:hypothetical protein ACET3X_006016 [Alternaria dauci]|uniref:Uncharacterized protein n=1 Tax=Alternaria dauci TaxID=48095 RepID=A0ABR3UHU1_9PLEO
MDHNQDNMNFDFMLDFDQQYAPTDPSLDNMFAPSALNHVYQKSAQHYNYQGHDPTGYNAFVPDATPCGAYHTAYQRPMTPDSTADHLEPHDGQLHGAFQDLNGQATNTQLQEETEYSSESWRTLVDFEIPDFRQTSIDNIPDLQALLTAYLGSYGPQSTAANATRMQYAKALAFALLTHYHPASQGYTVEPTSPGPMAKTGMNFILATDDKSDVWQASSSNKANSPQRPTKRELERAERAEQVAKVAEYNRRFAYMANLQWDYISPEDIAAFMVMCKTEVRDENTGMMTYEQHPHTYLIIMIDDFDQVPRLSKENTVHRSDILTDALCRRGKVRNGHGMLLYGPRLECYTFDRGNEWVYPDSDNEEGEQEPQDIEPNMEVLQSGGQDIDFDMRTMSLEIIDAAFRDIAVRQVAYMPGPQLDAEEVAGFAEIDEEMEE